MKSKVVKLIIKRDKATFDENKFLVDEESELVHKHLENLKLYKQVVEVHVTVLDEATGRILLARSPVK